MNCFKQYLTAYGRSGSDGYARVTRERKKSRNACYDIVLFRLPATWTRNTRHGTKIY